MKLPEGEIKLDGLDEKGKIHVPTIDISLPKGKTEVDLEVERHGGKVGKFHMPSVDISLAKMKLSEHEGKVEDPGAKGEMKKIYISLPKGKSEGEIDIKGSLGKGGKMYMPTFDVSPPKIKQPEYELTVEGPVVKGGKNEMPKIEAESRISSKLPTVKLPTVDISAPKVDLDFGISKGNDREEMELLKAEGGRPSSGTSFDMPDVSLKMPKFSLPKFGGKSKSSRDLKTEASTPDFDIHISSPQVDGEGRLTSVELGGDGKTKGKNKKPKMKMPTFGIFKKDADISIAGPDMEIKTKKEEIDIPKPEIGIENHEEKGKYRLKFPKFKKASPKATLPEGELVASLDSGMEGKAGFHAPGVTIKKFSMPGSGEPDAKLKVKIPSVELYLPAAKTSEQEVLLPKAEVDVSEADIRGYEGSLKIPKMPTIDISAPKIDLDVTLPKVKHETKIAEGGGTFKMPNIQMPDIDLSHPKSKGKSDIHVSEIEGVGGKFKMSGMKMPKVEISLPKGKHGAMDVDKGEHFKMPHMKMPNIDISPIVKVGEIEGPEKEIHGGAEKVTMPHEEIPNIDLSLPKGKGGEIERPDIEIEGGGGRFKIPHMKMPNIEISLPKGKSGKTDGPVIENKAESGQSQDINLPETEIGGGAKFKMPHMKMPNIDISLPKGKVGEIEGPDIEIEGGGGKFKMPHMKMPNVDLSLPIGKSGEISAPEMEIKGEKYKMPHMKMPNVDISLPKGKSGEIEKPEMEIEAGGGKFKMPHMKMPDVEISLPKGKTPDISLTETEMEGGEAKFKMPHMKMPNIDISLPKGKVGEIEGPDIEIEGGGGKFKMPHMKMPNVDLSLPKGKSGEINVPEMEIKGEKYKMPHMKMPNVDISLPKGKSGEIENPEMEIEAVGGKFKMPHMKMPDVDISLPKGKTPDICLTETEMEGGGAKFKMPHMKMPNIDISLPKGKVGGIEGPDIDIEGAGGKFQMPHMNMPNVEISLPKGKSHDINLPETEVKGGKFKMSHTKNENIDLSSPKGKTGGFVEPEVEIQAEGGKIKMPGIKMPKVDLSLSKGKSGYISAPAMEMDIKGGTLKMPNVDITLPKGKSGDINVPHMEIKGQDGRHNMPEIKLPKMDIKMAKITPGDVDVEIKQPSAEAEGNIKMPSIDMDMKVGTPENGADKTGSHAEEDNKIKIAMPKIDVECPKVDLELDLGFQKAMKDRKRIELPDLDLITGTKVKGPKVKGNKFKVGIPKMKSTGDHAVDVATNKTGKEIQGASGQFKIKKTKLGEGVDVGAGGSVVPNISLPDVGLSVSKGDSQEGKLGPGISAELPNLKLPNLEISGTGHEGAQSKVGEQEENDSVKLQMPKIALPSVDIKSKQGSAETTGTDTSGENGPNLGIKVPKIPDTEFDTGSDDHGTDTSTRQKIKIPKFGVALPAMSSPNARVDVKHPEVEYEGPKMPNVKKAVFVLVNPQTEHSDMSTTLAEVEVGVESGGAAIERPKIKMKPSFGKSRSKVKGGTMETEGNLDGHKSKGAKLKIPKVTFSPGKNSSFDIKGEGSSSSLNGEKDPTFQNGSKEDKAKSGKLKLPKIEFSSPYSKTGSGEDDLEMNAKLVKESSGPDGETKRPKGKSGKISFPGFKKKTSKGEEESQGNVVSSSARTEMLDRDSSESPTPMASMSFVSGNSRGQVEAESSKQQTEGGLQSTWFKAPKFNLKPHSTGILHITPEGSPRGSISSLQGLDEMSGTFRLQMPSMGFSTQEVSEEHVTTTKEGTVTVVTKTTKHTVTESRTDQTHTSLSDCNY
ncbi:neuroblast differentiation-associated protein AHNAK [Esox lucius]|uniref:neuroblast differentiation-associated protein AHNAK n=1 Tax=Esox lucius TaxID=8010 RepID=UPI0014775D67|nr:neuroblast differentiation-associated protein AHNAK [Esox lucius]